MEILLILDPIINSPIMDNYEEFQYENDEIYKWEMINNKKEGFDKFKIKIGNYYICWWHDDKTHGFGKQYNPNKKIEYKGYFDNNEYNGYGAYYDNGKLVYN